VKEPTSRGATQILQDLHEQLDLHFRDLSGSRQQLTPVAPVFALEHGLSDADLELVEGAVRSAVRQGFGATFRRWWLPFVVYAAESGYDYAGGEYWQTFEDSTPGWHENGDRDRIRGWFQRFADDYGGARPQGAFAEHFTIIAWPITHAVLPVHLQRNLAHLLYDFRTGLTAQLLQDPGALGDRLAARTGSYTEQFRYFCQNTALLGQVSIALLTGEEDDDESPYLLPSTFHRLVTGLSRERQAQQWLSTARQSARQIRAAPHGFVPGQRRPSRASRQERLPRPTDPRLLLRHAPGGWQAYAELLDLSSLITRLPHLSGELRSRRPSVAGAERTYLARGQLLFPGREVRLARWPRPGEPFITLERASDAVNHLIAEQCAITGGPTWLFHLRASGLAVEVRGKVMHPGSSYVLVTDDKATVPALPATAETAIEVTGMRAFNITVPDTVNESYAAAFAKVGVSLVANIAIRPVGIVASMWDGEGSVEWLAGEPGMIGIYAEQIPAACVVTLDGQPQALPWPAGQRNLFLRLDDLGVGTFEVSVALTVDSGKAIAEGMLSVTVRDPQVRPDTATAGEGIRLLADPAQPTLSDLWDGRAAISIDGPSSRPATLTVTLVSDEGEELAEIAQEVNLPMTPGGWTRTAAGIRASQRFKGHYDDAQSSRVTVSHSGIGFATLISDRGFQPLRWHLALCHDGSHVARLIDRTDGAQAQVELFTVDKPLVPVPCSPSEDIVVPPQGGLLRAAAGEAVVSALLPTQPNEVMRVGSTFPVVRGTSRTPREVMRLAAAHLAWATAERPADPFASYQCDMVLGAITREIASLIGQSYWAGLERRMRHASDLVAFIDDMQACVGEISSHRKLAERIAHSLWSWSTPHALRRGFADALYGILQGGKSAENHETALFVLTLADQPGQILVDWSPSKCEDLLGQIIASPVLLRAARFAVLGTRAFHGAVAVGEL
jgi:hypothetical protein